MGEVTHVQVDVVILGAGPAGAATALELSRLGLRAVLIDKLAAPDWKAGEGLPPEARPLLDRWGLWTRFVSAGHLPCPTYVSVWGAPVPVAHPALFNPYGDGWHLDRVRFDAMLAEAAVQAGAPLVRPAEVVRYDRTGRGWLLDLGPCEEISTAFLVDATGRSGWLARRLGAERHQSDRLVAACCVFAGADGDPSTLVESVPTGWWYTARVPGARRVVMYLSDSDLPEMRSARSREGWLTLLQQTRHVGLLAAGRPLLLGPRLAPAGTTYLANPVGDGWLAVGDAAAAFDPLSSQGIISALAGGRAAAAAIAAADWGTYRAHLSAVLARYRQQRTRYYGMERRWPVEPFWRRRQNVSPAL
jgi:flavin-dependent dehydrogenase